MTGFVTSAEAEQQAVREAHARKTLAD